MSGSMSVIAWLQQLPMPAQTTDSMPLVARNSHHPRFRSAVAGVITCTNRNRVATSIPLTAVLLSAATCLGQVSVLTWHYDNMRTGANIQESVLTPSNVVPTQFGKLFTQPVDGARVLPASPSAKRDRVV